jgi:hypothetical protein
MNEILIYLYILEGIEVLCIYRYIFCLFCFTSIHIYVSVYVSCPFVLYLSICLASFVYLSVYFAFFVYLSVCLVWQIYTLCKQIRGEDKRNILIFSKKYLMYSYTWKGYSPYVFLLILLF